MPNLALLESVAVRFPRPVCDRWFRGLPVILLIIAVQAKASPEPFGVEFQVNTYTTDYQLNPRVAGAADGRFVVVWGSNGSSGTDTFSYSIQGQRYAADGSELGGEFQINTYTSGTQEDAAVSMSPEGGFVVIWESPEIQGQRYASDGSALGDQFQVNSYVTNSQRNPSVSVGSNGDFVTVWASIGSSGTDTSILSVQGQRYASDGTARGLEFQINTYTTDIQESPSVAVGPDGGFVTVWESSGSSGTDTSGRSIQGQRFAADGSNQGGEFQINTTTLGSQAEPAVSFGADGNFVVVWESSYSSGSDTSGDSIQGQRFAADGSALGSEFQINIYTTGDQSAPTVSMESDGHFVVVWRSDYSGGSDASYSSVQGRRYASDGSSGSQFQVNSFTTSYQENSSVSVGPSGDFVVVWQNYGVTGTDSSGYSVRGQRFRVPFFEDGFESGDTSSWSSTSPP